MRFLANLFFTCVEICQSAVCDFVFRAVVGLRAGVIHIALPHVEFLEAVVEHREPRFVAYVSPAFGVVETGRGAAREEVRGEGSR